MLCITSEGTVHTMGPSKENPVKDNSAQLQDFYLIALAVVLPLHYKG